MHARTGGVVGERRSTLPREKGRVANRVAQGTHSATDTRIKR